MEHSLSQAHYPKLKKKKKKNEGKKERKIHPALQQNQQQNLFIFIPTWNCGQQ